MLMSMWMMMMTPTTMMTTTSMAITHDDHEDNINDDDDDDDDHDGHNGHLMKASCEMLMTSTYINIGDEVWTRSHRIAIKKHIEK